MRLYSVLIAWIKFTFDEMLLIVFSFNYTSIDIREREIAFAKWKSVEREIMKFDYPDNHLWIISFENAIDLLSDYKRVSSC